MSRRPSTAGARRPSTADSSLRRGATSLQPLVSGKPTGAQLQRQVYDARWGWARAHRQQTEVRQCCSRLMQAIEARQHVMLEAVTCTQEAKLD